MSALDKAAVLKLAHALWNRADDNLDVAEDWWQRWAGEEFDKLAAKAAPGSVVLPASTVEKVREAMAAAQKLADDAEGGDGRPWAIPWSLAAIETFSLLANALALLSPPTKESK